MRTASSLIGVVSQAETGLLAYARGGFTAAEVRARLADTAAVPPYRPDSIGRALIEDWLARTAVDAGSCR